MTEPTDRREPADRLHRQGGRWAKGQSGNPGGRRHGSRNRATVALEKILADGAADVLRATIAAAKGGDTAAMKIILDRVLPPRRGRPVRLDLPAVESAGDAATALSVVIRTMAERAISPDEAAVIAGVIATQQRTTEPQQTAPDFRAMLRREAEAYNLFGAPAPAGPAAAKD